jgi:sugar O-acyltransferase (sialic acid O-acetyltransferase NeuD family)
VTDRRSVVIIGAGGHGKVVLSTLRHAGIRVKEFYDDDSAKWGGNVQFVQIVGSVDDLRRLRRRVRAVIAVGDNRRRKEIAESLDLDWTKVVHPRAFVDLNASIGLGTVVFAGALVQPDARIGRHSIVDTGASVDHDCVLGDYVHVAPNASLAGTVHVGDGCLLGTGCSVCPGVRIGSWSIVGAGSAVIRDLPDGVVAVGCPARVIRSTRPAVDTGSE